MIIKNSYCLFEQSGTFKNEFIKLGINSFDYDIQNEFGFTDNMCDLFREIDRAYRKYDSIFDDFDKDDLIVAFFPCTRFECQASLYFRGKAYGQTRWSDEEKVKYVIKLHADLSLFYDMICKLFYICYVRGLRLIVENPVTQPHYLTHYFPVAPAIIDNDRRKMGDYYKKPTQWWFINCKPEQNAVFEPMEYYKTMNIK